jgi:rsbT co-antagonist protein RsbR
MTDEILDAVAGHGARWLILDLTGAQIPDERSAARLLRIVRAVELLGSRCLVSGVPSALARSLLELGADLGAVPTFRSLRQALEHARRAARPAERPLP